MRRGDRIWGLTRDVLRVAKLSFQLTAGEACWYVFQVRGPPPEDWVGTVLRRITGRIEDGG